MGAIYKPWNWKKIGANIIATGAAVTAVLHVLPPDVAARIHAATILAILCALAGLIQKPPTEC